MIFEMMIVIFLDFEFNITGPAGLKLDNLELKRVGKDNFEWKAYIN